MKPYLIVLLVSGAASPLFVAGCGDASDQLGYAGNTEVRIDWLFPVHPDWVESNVCCGDAVDTCLDELFSEELVRYESGPDNPYVVEPSTVTEMVLDLPEDSRCAFALYLECGGEILCTASQMFDVPFEGQLELNIVSVCNPPDPERDACLAAS